MNKTLNVTALIFIGLLRISAADQIPNKAVLQKAFLEKCDEVNKFYKENGFSIFATNPQECIFQLKDNRDYKEMVGEFDPSERALCSAQLLCDSGKIIEFCNDAAEHAVYAPNVPVYPKAPPPKWTKEHAIEIAAKFADIFVKPFGSQLGPPLAYFTDHTFDMDRKTLAFTYAQGSWTVKWGRQTTSGVPYASDGVSVNMSEQFGPDAIFLFFTTDYEDEHITPILRDKALIETREGLDKILAWGPAKAWLSGVHPQGEPSTGLMIVQPNDLPSQKSLTDLVFSGQHKACLAWVSLYHVVNPSDPKIHGDVSVYINAKDGSFLGGYF